MYDHYYRQGFMAKAAERGYPDYAMAPVGAVVGWLSGGAMALAAKPRSAND